MGLLLVSAAGARAATPETGVPRFRVVAIAEAGGIHAPFVEAAKVWLNQLAAKNQFAVDYIQNTDKIDDEFLSHYQLFIQLNYPPYNWTPAAQADSWPGAPPRPASLTPPHTRRDRSA